MSIFGKKVKYVFFYCGSLPKRLKATATDALSPQKDTRLWGQIIPFTNPMDSTMANVIGNCHVLFTKCSNPKSTRVAVKELNKEY